MRVQHVQWVPFATATFTIDHYDDVDVDIYVDVAHCQPSFYNIYSMGPIKTIHNFSTSALGTATRTQWLLDRLVITIMVER